MRFLALIPLLALGGCDWLHQDAPQVPIVVPKTAIIDYPPECTSPDPQWIDPPKGFEPLKHIGDRERMNHDHFDDVTNDRDVCRAGLKANQKKG